MPAYYAPCLSHTTPNIVYAEEVVYPDFEVSLRCEGAAVQPLHLRTGCLAVSSPGPSTRPPTLPAHLLNPCHYPSLFLPST